MEVGAIPDGPPSARCSCYAPIPITKIPAMRATLILRILVLTRCTDPSVCFLPPRRLLRGRRDRVSTLPPQQLVCRVNGLWGMKPLLGRQ